MSVRFEKTARGEVAILPRREYETLAAKAAEADEDAGTARIVARARREIAVGAPLIPKEMADRIGGGENPIRVLRDWRGITQVELAQQTQLGQGYLSDLETGRKHGSTASLRAIAQALAVPLELLLGD